MKLLSKKSINIERECLICKKLYVASHTYSLQMVEDFPTFKDSTSYHVPHSPCSYLSKKIPSEWSLSTILSHDFIVDVLRAGAGGGGGGG